LLPEFASIALTMKKILTHRSDEAMNSIGDFQKKVVISVISVAKPKNIVVIAFTYVLERFV
jgi:hypothetical protein